MNRAISIADLAALAKRRLPKVVWDYLEGGAEDEITLRANREAIERLTFQPRVLAGGASRDLTVELFGARFATPFLIGPTGLNGLYWPDADLALARAAAKASVGFVLSTASNISLERVAEDVEGSRWFQLYPWGDSGFSDRLLERARRAGYSAIVVTVDSLVAGKRERDLRNGFAHQLRLTPRVIMDGLRHPAWLMSVWMNGGAPRFENLTEFLGPGASANELAEFTRSRRNPALDWSDVERLKARWKGPLLVKGVLSACDVEAAVRAGVDGLVVSNHGGRQLDGAPASMDVLEEVVAASAGRLVVLVDSGFRRGADVAKAIALGASAVLLGRAPLYGLAAGGEAGVARALEILRDEVDRTLGLIGCSAVSQLSADHLRRQRTG